MDKKIEKWLKKEGLEFKVFGDLNSGGFTPKGYLIFTEYDGLYAPMQVYDLHAKIKKHFSRTGNKCVSSPMHTSLYVYSKF